MSQVTTTSTSPKVTPQFADGVITTVTDNAILVGVWSTPMSCVDQGWYTATPGTGGSILVQFSANSGVTWSDAAQGAVTAVYTAEVPPSATLIRATAVTATGTLVINTPTPAIIGGASTMTVTVPGATSTTVTV